MPSCKSHAADMPVVTEMHALAPDRITGSTSQQHSRLGGRSSNHISFQGSRADLCVKAPLQLNPQSGHEDACHGRTTGAKAVLGTFN